jgi:hypothetical protein
MNALAAPGQMPCPRFDGARSIVSPTPRAVSATASAPDAIERFCPILVRIDHSFRFFTVALQRERCTVRTSAYATPC